jgi:hypothetical protein
LVTFDWVVGAADAVSLEGAPPLLAGLSASDFFYRRLMPGVLAKDKSPRWRGAGGLLHVARVGQGTVVYLAVRPEEFEANWLPDRPAWQETMVYWPTTKFYRIVSTILTNAGADSRFHVDLLGAESSSTTYLHEAIDFDPMESRTW